MKRDAQLIEKAKKHGYEWYDYKVPAIEEFFQQIKDSLRAKAMAFLPAIYEDVKQLDFSDYKAEDIKHDQYVFQLPPASCRR